MKENESLRAIFIEVFKRENLGDEEDFFASNYYSYYFKDLEKLLKGLYLTVNNATALVAEELATIDINAYTKSLVFALMCNRNQTLREKRNSIDYKSFLSKLRNRKISKITDNIEVTNMKNDIRYSNHTAAEIIKNRLIENGGCATYYTYDGTEHQVYVIKNGLEFATDALPGNITYSFDIFNCVSDAINANGGKAKKGIARGNRVGDINFDEKTVAGYLAMHFFGKHYGETSVDPSFFLFGIMEWAKIITNNRGYVEFEDWYKKESEKQCI